jgi:soluble lytic murein transglycosylase-like protein
MRLVRRGVAALITACALPFCALTGQATAASDVSALGSTPLPTGAFSGALDTTLGRGNSSVLALTAWDAQLYAAAFEAADKGDFETASAKLAQTSDKSLAGYVEFRRLMAPSGPKVAYEELSAWLDRYADLPGADRVYNLARKRKPADALEPQAPKGGVASQLWRRVQSAAAAMHVNPLERSRGYTPAPDNRRYVPPAETREARELFYGGDTRTAYHLAVATGERWIAGLAAFKLGDYVDALRRFETVARDGSEGAWMRSGAAYWASRSAIAAGAPELAPGYLQMAAATPYTFYGQLAERQLGWKSQITAEDARDPIREIAEAQTGIQKAAGVDQLALARFMRGDLRAKRAVALSQLGMVSEAGQELRIGLIEAKTDEERRSWTTLALSLNAPIVSNADQKIVRGVNAEDYPTPYLTPRGGFTVDKAMVYALIRQESRFNPDAVSPVGARGLMQVMPTTAAYVTGDDRYKTDMRALKDPSTNLRVGQDYYKRLLDRLTPQGDLLRATAAYNGGPGAVMKAETNAGGASDPLMLIESLPAQETRDYVEKVVAGYWIYRRIFGEDSKTLDMVASGKTPDIRLDR